MAYQGIRKRQTQEFWTGYSNYDSQWSAADKSEQNLRYDKNVSFYLVGLLVAVINSDSVNKTELSSIH